jgi:outer membrane receptor protein involved in Fe transport
MRSLQASRVTLLVAATAIALQVCGRVALAEEAVDPATAPATESEGTPAQSSVAAADAAQAPKPYDATIPVPDRIAKEEIKRERDAVELDEVVVTATKRAQSSRKIPATVNVLKGEDLEAIGAREMQDYLRQVPGITLQEGETNYNRTLSVRGIGPQPGANTTTGVLIDNVSVADPYSSYLVPDLDPFDLKDLEILKGPQGTLFGAAALNGALRYVPNKPEFGQWQTRGFANWASVTQGGEAVVWGAALNVPLGDYAALRGVAVHQDLPGLYDDINANGKHAEDADEGDKQMYRVLGAWQPFSDFTINALWLKQSNYRGSLSVANNDDGEFLRTDTPGPSTAAQEFEVGNLELRYDFDWATLISETSRSKKSNDADYDASAVVEALATRGVESLRLHIRADTDAIAQEIRLVSPSGDSPWVWIGGVYYNQYEAQFGYNAYVANTEFLRTVLTTLGVLNLPIDLISVLVPTPDGLSAQYIQYKPLEAQEQSLFGELTRKFFDDQLELTVGGRFYKQELKANVDVAGLLTAYADVLGFSGNKEMASDGFSPKASIKWQMTPDILFYTTAARGFQFGGLNQPAPIPTDNVYPLSYKPSTIWSYEAGFRTDWFRRRLRFDITGFWIDWTDMQITQGAPSGNTDYTDNIGKARSRGVESSLRWLTPIPGLTLSNAASYIEATVQEAYETADGFPVPVGTLLPAAPRVQTSTTLAYIKYFGGLTAGANVTYSTIGDAFNNITHDLHIYDFGTLDAGITLAAPQWPMAPELAFSATNILDERGLVGARMTHLGNSQTDDLIPASTFINYQRPRAYAARIAFKF